MNDEDTTQAPDPEEESSENETQITLGPDDFALVVHSDGSHSFALPQDSEEVPKQPMLAMMEFGVRLSEEEWAEWVQSMAEAFVDRVEQAEEGANDETKGNDQ